MAHYLIIIIISIPEYYNMDIGYTLHTVDIIIQSKIIYTIPLYTTIQNREKAVFNYGLLTKPLRRYLL